MSGFISPSWSQGQLSGSASPFSYSGEDEQMEYAFVEPGRDRSERQAEPPVERAPYYHHYSREGSPSPSESSGEVYYLDVPDDFFGTHGPDGHFDTTNIHRARSRSRSIPRDARSRSRSEHGQTRFPPRQVVPSLEQLRQYYPPDSPLSRSRSRGRSPGRGEEGMRMSDADTPYTLDQDDGDSQAPPILQPYHDLERWTYNENHTWPHRPEDEERAEQVDWIKLQSDNDCNRSMMVVKEEPVDGSEIDQDRRTAFQKLGLTVRREEPISYNLIQEITLPVPCPPEAEDGEEERTSVSKVFIWDHLEGEHNPYGCGSSICEGYAYDDPYAPPEFEEPSEGACKPYQKYAPESIADVFDMLCRREAFAEVDTGLPPDAPLKEVSIKVATFNAKSDLSMGIGVLKEEELTRIHHETCGTEFCAGSRTEEEARNELVEPAYRGDKCRPDVWYIFEPEDGVSHRHSRLDLYGEASQLDVLRAQGVELGGYGEFEEPETPEGSEPASPVELEEPGEPEESGLASPEEFEEPVEPDPGTPEEQEEQEGSEEFEEEE